MFNLEKIYEWKDEIHYSAAISSGLSSGYVIIESIFISIVIAALAVVIMYSFIKLNAEKARIVSLLLFSGYSMFAWADIKPALSAVGIILFIVVLAYLEAERKYK